MAQNEARVVEVADEMVPGDEAPPGTPARLLRGWIFS